MLHTEVQRVENKIINTTVGRVIFNTALPKSMPFVNGMFKKKGLQQLVQKCYLTSGLQTTVEMLDGLKHMGFTYATRSGMSIGIEDLIIPKSKVELSEKARDEVIKVEQQYLEGAITNGERYNKVIAVWSDVTEKIADAMFKEMERRDTEGSSTRSTSWPTRARGSKQQIRQLAGHARPDGQAVGEIIETPIKANFREGSRCSRYFISTHGARKGLADTALKTADSGYLTRRLVDVAQDVIVSDRDCGTLDGIEARAIVESGEIIEPLRDRIIGRVSLERIMDPLSGDVLLDVNEEIDEEKAAAVQDSGIEKVKIRSVLTCASRRGVCAKCYGRDLATGRLVEMGLAVGVVAAQSIGEPGTQLTMRTFHIGGTASRISDAVDARFEAQGRREVRQPAGRRAADAIGRDRAHRHEPHGPSRDSGRQGPRPRALPDSYGARLRITEDRTSRTARSWSNGIHIRSRFSPRNRVRSGSRTSSRASRSRGPRRGHGSVAAHHRRLAG